MADKLKTGSSVVEYDTTDLNLLYTIFPELKSYPELRISLAILLASKNVGGKRPISFATKIKCFPYIRCKTALDLSPIHTTFTLSPASLSSLRI